MSNPGLIVVESISSSLIILIVSILVKGFHPKISLFSRNQTLFSSGLAFISGLLATLGLGYFLDLFYDIAVFEFYFAVTATISLLVDLAILQAIWKKQDVMEKRESDIDEQGNIDGPVVLYLKSYIFIIVIVWIVAIFYLFNWYFSNITISEEFQWSFEWAFYIEIISIMITAILNSILPIEKKVPNEVLKKAVLSAVLISYGIWTLQLIIFGYILEISTGNGYYVPLYLQFILMIIYAVVFFIALKRKFIPEFTAKLYHRINQKIKLEKSKYASVSDETETFGNETVLEVQDLKTHFFTEEGIVKAVEGVSFQIKEDEILGLVGETGCGKSVTALSIMQIVPNPGKIIGGKIIFNDENLLEKTQKEMRKYRGNQITMIFQDPLNSVNPVYKVGDQIAEVYLLHKQDELLLAVQENAKKMEVITNKLVELRSDAEDLYRKEKIVKKNLDKTNIEEEEEHGGYLSSELDNNKQQLETLTSLISDLESELRKRKKLTSIYSVAREWSENLLHDVGIPSPELIIDHYPHELSGGMRQRIMIAIGLACSPKLLIADEPTTALDVTIQIQILQLMKDLQKKYNTSILYITHDLGLISKMCNRVAVMYSGFIVEYGDIKKLFTTPYHPYTKGLIGSVPMVGKQEEFLPIIPGTVPNLIYPPEGCRFHPRCNFCFEPCDSIIPQSIELENDYFVACHLYDPAFKEGAIVSIQMIEKSKKNEEEGDK